MIVNKIYYNPSIITSALLLLLIFSCTREIDELEPATFPTTSECFHRWV